MRVGRQRYIERRHALGLKAPGGRPRGRWWTRPKDAHERMVREMADLIEAFPAPPAKPEEQWTHSEILLENARLGGLEILQVLKRRVEVGIRMNSDGPASKSMPAAPR